MWEYHFDHHVVGISIWHETCEGTTSSHTETATVVDDNQIATASLDKFS